MNVCVKCRKSGYGSWCKTCALVFKWEQDPNSIYSMALQVIGKMCSDVEKEITAMLDGFDFSMGVSKGSHVAMREQMKPIEDRARASEWVR